MCYLNYRILAKMNDHITINYMPPGHTRFGVDWAFGLFKQKFRHSEAFSLKHLQEIVLKSTPNSRVNQCVLTSDERGTTLLLPFMKWNKYFEDMKWAKIPDITQYYHFEFSNETPGYVWCKRELDDEPTKFLIGLSIDESVTLEEEVPTGLPRARQQYLYEKLREFCRYDFKDVLCPAPSDAAIDDKFANPKAGTLAVVSSVSKKKGRRLRKVPESEENSDDVDTPGSPTIHEKRGRKPSDSAQQPRNSDTAAEDTAAPPAPKRRGRPRKL
jgi:hypothetical protein